MAEKPQKARGINRIESMDVFAAASMVANTSDVSLLREAVADGRDEILLAAAGNDNISPDMIARLFERGGASIKRKIITTHIKNREIDLAKIVADSEDIDAATVYVEYAARNNEQELDNASEILSIVNPGIHEQIWNILAANNLLSNAVGSDFSMGAKAFFMFAASINRPDRWLKSMPKIVSSLNSI